MTSLSDSDRPVDVAGSEWGHNASVASILKWCGLPVILLAELLFLTIRFDTASLSQASEWAASFGDHISILPQLVAVMLVATLVFGGRQVSEELSRLCHSDGRHRRWPVWLAAQMLLYLLFYWVTIQVFEINRGVSLAWIAGWAALGTACGLAWLAALVHPSNWQRLAARLAGYVLVGAVIGVLAWAAGQYATQYWGVLAGLTFDCVGFALRCMGLEASRDIASFTLGTSEFQVRIAPSCSGYEGMGLAVVFVSGYLWWCRSDHFFPRSLLLLPIAVGLMFAANCVRIVFLILLGHFGWPEIAVGGFHSQAGWLAFNFVVLAIVATARVSPFFSRVPMRSVETPRSRSLPFLGPFVLLMLTVMLTGVVQTGFDWLYPMRFLAIGAAILWFAKQYPPRVWQRSGNWFGPICGVLVYFVWLALASPERFSSDVAFYTEARAQAPAWFAAWCLFRVLGSVITVPLAEEFAFRGYLIPWFSSRKEFEPGTSQWSWNAILISSIAFGALHPGRWIEATIAGGIYSFAFCRRGHLMDAVLAHATTNALIAGQAILFRHWGLWA
ncbi:Transmembrane exosortase [Stieleria neptunia]|uniref:Transmembrane exosortase n=1 Tax=Stieleria neptunia TaxID=2527979 RepID=A0A518HTW9_9BACT|nr:exosortase E/protease, VPEID-CTERM system [Stieleria neptunia]QDV44264.1 Transmembrane exosortase [Stieleria neptunia]